MLLSSRASGLVNCCAIGVPENAQSEWLQDIATVSGATLVQRLTGQGLGDLRIDQWGMAERLESGRGTTQAVGMLPPEEDMVCLLYTSPSPRDVEESRMPSSA